MKRIGIHQRLVLMMAVAAIAVPWPEVAAQYFRFGKNKVQYESSEWYYLSTRHFDIYFYREAEDLAQFTAHAAEDAYRDIESLFRHRISERIPILVYNSHNEFAVTNAVDLPVYSDGIGGVTELFKNRVAIPFMGDYRDFRRVLHHELVHAVLNDLFYGGSLQSLLRNNIRVRLPDWFNEGLAEYAALGWDSNSDMYVRSALLDDALPSIPGLGGYLAYRGGQSLWDYIAAQYGREKIAEILHRANQAGTVDAGFGHATGLTLAEMSERWRQSLREIHFPELAARDNLTLEARPVDLGRRRSFSASPALSPRGDLLAFIAARGAFFDVYLARVEDGRILRRLVSGQDNTDFEALRILTPGMSWSPDGEQIAVAVKSGRSEAIALVDVATGEAHHHHLPDIDHVFSVAWSPRGRHIALSASKGGFSDIYLLDIVTGESENLTNDHFSDHEPAWSPDGRLLVFHSDRGDRTADPSEDVSMHEHDIDGYDLYMMMPGEREEAASSVALTRLTNGDWWDNRSARFGEDSGHLLFISDRNGVFNLYELNLDTSEERPVTNVVRGIFQYDVSSDGAHAAVVSLRGATPSIYLLSAPFERRLDEDVLRPNVWAQRISGDSSEAPASVVASASVRRSNPFLRDAVSGAPSITRRNRLAEATDLEEYLDQLDRRDHLRVLDEPGAVFTSDQDSILYGRVAVDFSTALFDETVEEVLRDPGEYSSPSSRYDPLDLVDEDGNYAVQKYKLRFSPDIIYGTAGYDVLYGVQGVTQMLFSDLLGNHQIFVSTNLLIDLRNSDYILSYSYLPRRTGWTVSSYHVSRLLPDYDRLTYYRYRQYGASLAAGYPIDKFRRVDLEVHLLGVSQSDVGDPSLAAAKRAVFYPSLSYTIDYSRPGFTHPVDGNRMAFGISASPARIGGSAGGFLTVLSDMRFYQPLGGNQNSLAIRLSAGSSFGSGSQLFFTSGTQNWINRRFDEVHGFPIEDAADFVFARPILPLRGYDINARNGTRFGLVNLESRFGLFGGAGRSPVRFLPIHSVQGTFFVDAAVVWGGSPETARPTITARDVDGRLILDDMLVGAGFGVRSILLGFPVRIDYAWPFDGHSFGDRRFYVSIGLDF